MKIEQSVRLAHAELTDTYDKVQTQVSDLLEKTCAINRWYFEDRSKGQESYALKIYSGDADGYLIEDFYACTIVVPNLRDVDAAKDLVATLFEVKETRPAEIIKSRPTDFNFDGLRIYCTLRTKNNLNDFKFEVQIKTFLEHGWAQAAHDFSYKGDSISWAKERLAAQLKAILDNVDLSIFEMETIAKSSLLNKRSIKYEEKSELKAFFENTVASKYNLQLPDDLRKLVSEVYHLISKMKLSQENLEKILETETQAGRGYNLRNISIYSVILLSIYNTQKSQLLKILKKKPRQNRDRIVIPAELELEEELDASKYPSAVLLKKERVRLN